MTETVFQLDREELWKSVWDVLDDLDSEQAASYQAEIRRLDVAAADGLVGVPGRQSSNTSG